MIVENPWDDLDKIEELYKVAISHPDFIEWLKAYTDNDLVMMFKKDVIALYSAYIQGKEDSISHTVG